MKKIIFSLLFFCITAGLQHVAAQTWEWAKSSKQCPGPDRLIEAAPTVVDPHGNIYITGRGAGNCDVFGPDTVHNLYAGSGAAIFLTSYDSAGNVRWVRSPTASTNNAVSENLAADDSGNIYMAGMFFNSTITFDTITLTNLSGNPNYLVKYDSSGNVLWARKCTSGMVTNCQVAVSHDGSVYLLGTFFGNTITFGSYTLTNSGMLSTDLFLVKYDAAGNVIWAVDAGGSSYETAYVPTCDTAGNVYITGLFQSPFLIFGTTILANSDPSLNNMFIAKYNSSGTPIWATQIPIGLNPSDGYGYPSIAADNSGNLYANGEFEGDSVVVGSYHFLNTSPGTTDMFIAKYNSSGTLLWAKQGGGTSMEYGFDFTFDAAGNTWMTLGSESGSITLDTAHITMPASPGGDASATITFDATGRIINVITLPLGGDDQLGIAANAFGDIYLGGDYIGGPFVLGPDTLDTVGVENFFVAKLKTSVTTGTLNVSSISSASGVTVYPNPANNLLTVMSDMPADKASAVRIVNMLGQTLKTVPVTGKITEVTTADIPNGLYICNVEISGNTTTRKILINH